MAFSRSPIRRDRRGGFTITLGSQELELVTNLLASLRELLGAGDRDPSARRLWPTAYPDDEEREAEYRALVHDELLESRLAALDTVEAALRRGRFDEEQFGAWMQSLNSLRLVLGTRLDVDEELTADDVDADDPRAPAFQLYHWLGWLLEVSVDAAGR